MNYEKSHMTQTKNYMETNIIQILNRECAHTWNNTVAQKTTCRPNRVKNNIKRLATKNTMLTILVNCNGFKIK